MPTATSTTNTIKPFYGTRLVVAEDARSHSKSLAIVPVLKPGQLGVSIPVNVVRKQADGSFTKVGGFTPVYPSYRHFIDYKA